MIWALRGFLAVAALVLALVVLSLVRVPGPPPATEAAPAPATSLPAPPPPATAAPTPTVQRTPVTDTIVSRVLRVVPTPESHAVPDVEMGGHRVEVRDFDYAPTELHIHVGDWVTWTNGGQEDHDLNSLFGSSAEWKSGPIFSTQSYTRTFGFAGRYEYICTYHPTMRGVIVVEP